MSDNQNTDPILPSPPLNPHFLTIHTGCIFPAPSKIQKIDENQISPLRDKIISLLKNKISNQQDKTLEEIEEQKRIIKLILIQLATLKTYSKIQNFDDDNFEKTERSNYGAFLDILNTYNYDKDDISKKILKNIDEEYKKS